MKRFAVTVGSILLVVSAGVATVAVIKYFDSTRNVAPKPAEATPELSASQVAGGLNHPWDIAFLPDDTLLFTERSGELSKIVNGRKVVLGTPEDVQPAGEGGLMGLAVDPEYATNRHVYACFNTNRGDIRVVRWTLNATVDALQERRDIITGIPAASGGRHSGCQLAFGPDENLWVGTGDAADDKQPQDISSLGGKILRVTRDGEPAGDNPVGVEKRIYSYGHRNVQAIAFYESKRDKSFGISVEHGPDRDDEVNELRPGNFGWAPGPGYDESVPMTDAATYPDAIGSVWSSGEPTIAPSGAAFVQGASWGRYEGWLAVSVLKDKKLLLLNLSNGSVSGVRTFFEDEYGRLRAATLGPDGALYVSTDNGTDDSILRITTTGG